MDIELKIIGRVFSDYSSLKECPNQGDEDTPIAEISLEEKFVPALERLSCGQEIEVLTWMHQGDRETLQCHPRGEQQRPLHGVFLTRSPNRPNPIGLHRVRVLQIDRTVIKVHPLEVLHGTPVIDIKPAASPWSSVPWGENISALDGQKLQEVAHLAWSKDLLNGLNSNLSIRRDDQMIVTCAGCVTGHLNPGDLVCVDLLTGEFGTGQMSSEAKMHRDIYANQTKAKAILHSHPPYLVALSLARPDLLLHLPLYESEIFKNMLTCVPSIRPGTEELARSVGLASRNSQAIFLSRHGLVCWSETLIGALGLSEEIEGLARIQWLSKT
ncbi:MAG TPA: tRNA (N6-threonylcarbamoyladenosine(37)-N6)-methyltransferase TrmO [Desulfohalobiaceae bacterium]|nr:tRNA (N6-threonylcarbamoyladenosine(37)-N6)-methyltransferase TrmO [Desulfohalobiaceae bacterium]